MKKVRMVALLNGNNTFTLYSGQNESSIYSDDEVRDDNDDEVRGDDDDVDSDDDDDVEVTCSDDDYNDESDDEEIIIVQENDSIEGNYVIISNIANYHSISRF